MFREKKTKAAQLYNPFESWQYPGGRKLKETVAQFLRRVPPATSEIGKGFPWIIIANPFVPRRSRRSESHTSEGIYTDPTDDDVAKFVTLGQNLLEELTDDLAHTIDELWGQAFDKITKAQDRLREAAVAKLREIATEHRCTSGKWMLFVSPSEVNAVWEVIARSTAEGDLGTAAKVAPFDGEDKRGSRVICISTADFNNLEDVKRVLAELKELGCVSTSGRPIYYKADFSTYLGVNYNNEWGIKSWLYSSAEFLSVQKRMESFLKRKGL